MFGSDEALDSLIIEAKRRGIHIILDGVFNHTGSDSVYFKKKGKYDTVGAYQSKDSEFYDWYNFRKYPNDYECWWNVEILPRVMSDNESYKKFIMGKGGVVEKWMNKGIAGFRLDVADELSDSFLESFNSKVKSVKPDGIIYGEVWEDASNKIAYNTRKSYFNGKELDSVMNYPLKDAIIDYIVNGNSSTFVNVCTELYSHYTKDAANLLMNVLGTHDTERILTVLAGEKSSSYTNKELSTRKLSDEERAKAVRKLKIAYTLIATMPGIPCIFYGDEAGMEGYRDPFNRKPYPWGREDNSLIEHYKKIGKIRNDEPIYKEGLIKIIECNENVLAFARYDSKDKFILTIVNRSESLCYKLNSSVKLQDLLTNEEVNTINPLSSYIIKCKGFVDDLSVEIKQI
jgi:glycosidase